MTDSIPLIVFMIISYGSSLVLRPKPTPAQNCFRYCTHYVASFPGSSYVLGEPGNEAIQYAESDKSTRCGLYKTATGISYSYCIALFPGFHSCKIKMWEWPGNEACYRIDEGLSVYSLRNKLLTTAGSKLPNSLDVGFVLGTSASLNIEGNNVVCREGVGSSLVSQLF